MREGESEIGPGSFVCRGQYRILSLLGRGEFGSVFLAQGAKALVALKVVSTQGWSERAYRAFNAHVVREASLLRTLDHPALPKLIDFQAQGSDYFLAMEWFRGTPLDQKVAQFGALELGAALTLLCQGVELLEYLRRGCTPPIVLGDIKPQNLLHGEDGRFRFVDLGLAGPVGSPPIEGFTAYTPGFSAPERRQGVASDPRQDLYSLSATFVFAVAGISAPEVGPGDTRRARIREALLSGGPRVEPSRTAFRRLADMILVALELEPAERTLSLERLCVGVERCRAALAHQGDGADHDADDDPLERLYRGR